MHSSGATTVRDPPCSWNDLLAILIATYSYVYFCRLTRDDKHTAASLEMSTMRRIVHSR